MGDSASREDYKKALVEYLTEYEDELSEDSQKRLQTNPMRILDSKDEHDRKILMTAPKLVTYLNRVSRDWLFFIETILESLGIPFVINPHLVRGLDYYCHTVFEFVTKDLGSQGTVLAGGRYDGLVQTLGGHNVDGIGWAAGVERLALMLDDVEAESPQISLIPNDNSTFLAIKMAYHLRSCGIRADYLYSGNIRKHMQHANSLKSPFALIIDAYGAGVIPAANYKLKDMESGNEYILSSPFEMPEELQHIEWMPKLSKALKEFFNV